MGTAQELERDKASVSAAGHAPLVALIKRQIEAAGGWLPFDRYMELALYAPGLGYYTRHDRQFGQLQRSGSDFVTAPELSPLFGATLAAQLLQTLQASDTDEIWEFGAGSGALAEQLLSQLGPSLRRYSIVDLSGALRAKQRERLALYADKVRWLDALPSDMQGVVIGNEVLDAMPVKLLYRSADGWLERGVSIEGEGFAWSERPTSLTLPIDAVVAEQLAVGTVTELHQQADAFVATLAERLSRGAAFFIDYGFPDGEYYHPQRVGGTLMCHRAHMADTDPLSTVGNKDITAHVNFSSLALAGQDAGFEVIGYTSQARFLLNCGIATRLDAADLPSRVHAHRLLAEHEMGELFKVIGFARGCSFAPIGFVAGDRLHRL